APIVFSLSPLVGTPLTTSAKFAVVAKSPLTNRLNDALSSSHFALAAKKSGCDAIVLTGACTTPSILILDDGKMRLEPAGDLWGQPASVVEETLRQRLGPRFHCAVIGPAGEQLVRYATISHSERDRKSTRLNSSHVAISYAVFCLKKKKKSRAFRNPDAET